MTHLYEIPLRFDEKTNTTSFSVIDICKNYNQKIIHIRTANIRGHVIKFFWNNIQTEIIKGSGKLKCIDNILSLAKNNCVFESYVKDVRGKTPQLGDSIFYYKKLSVDSESYVFGYVIGFFIRNEIISIEIKRTSLDKNINNTVIKLPLSQQTPIFILSDGMNDRYRHFAPTNNLPKVKYKYQIDNLEFLLSNIRFKNLLKKYNSREIPIGEKAFKECHGAIFDGIYDWSGIYRKHEVVVGDRNRETTAADAIKSNMRSCFSRVNRTRLNEIKDISQLANLLTNLHKELAWIHPFEDGNGRCIRLYLQLLSVSFGYKLRPSILIGDKKKKSFYHYAVRKAVYDDNNRYLNILLQTSLEPMPIVKS